MNMIVNERMTRLKTATWILSGLLMAACGAFAQEAGQTTRQRAELAVHKTTDNPAGIGAYEKLLQDADKLIKSGKSDEAYSLLFPFEFEHAGDERFDYLIGVAALDSGKPDKATLAFERVLMVNPNSAAARLDMARAYYQLGDLPRARTEFALALTQNPSEATRANIQRYLDVIDAQQDGNRTRFSGYIEGAVGRDSNVNYSNDQPQIFVDRFSTIATLDQNNVKVADKYYAVAAGGEIKYGLNANWGLYAGGDLRKRNYQAYKQFDPTGLDARAGVIFEAKANRFRAGVLGGQYNLGGTRNSDTTGFKGEWRHAFSPSNQLNTFAQAVKYRFAETVMKPNDFDQQAFGIGWLHVLPSGKSTLSGSMYYGTEKDVSPIVTTASPNGGRNDGAKRFKGVRVGGQAVIDERTTLFASAGVQAGDYSKINYYFQRQRNDRLYELAMGANWRWDNLWLLRPQLNYSKNNSNIAIYGYGRSDISLTVRREFR